jgi:hypothetical protein
MEERIENKWYHKQHHKNEIEIGNEEAHRKFILAKEKALMYGTSMSLNDIGSIITLTSAETEELARTGRLKSDEKFKKRKLIL